ncbi:testis-expressed protein 15 [Mixophyes fleayi]|uniref:testis-expressed protein 15 n=1 Tax=Mixophyes fleayi TaxID=3061075 RepID=UPI003F4DDE5B
MEDQTMFSFGVKHAENKLLHNFTIPKIKRDTEKDCFVRCMPNRREFSDILDTFNKERLNMSCDLKKSWNFLEMKLVINKDLEQNFFEKRTEMKELGRHGRELEEKFCFLVVQSQVATDISNCGLTSGNMTTSVLGNPEMGVYLFRHIDVALNFAYRRNRVSNIVVVIKVLCGKVKKINTSSAMKIALDPTPNFDSHVSKKVPLWNDPFDEQVANSLIYVYEYDSNFKPVKTPRQCLPIASVHATFVAQKTVKTSVPVRLPPKSISSGNDTFASCTVAQRIGKGKDATIVFKSVRSTLLKPSEKETSQNNGSVAEAQTIAFTDTDQRSDILVTSTMFQNQVTAPEISASHQNITVALQNLISSSMVITSKSMKDPRLLKRNEQEALIPADQYQTGHQKQNILLCENMVSSSKESEENFVRCENSISKTPLYLSFEEMRVSDANFMSKEQLMKKLKKYSSFLALNKKERDARIHSLKKLSNVEKAGLSRKLCIYDKYYRMFANQLEIAKEGNQSKMALSAHNSPPACPQVAVSVPVSTSACNNKGNENGHIQNKSQLISLWTDSGQGEGSQYMSQETSQKYKSPAGAKNSLRENYSEGLCCPKNNSVDKSTVITSKAKDLKTVQSSVTHVNYKTDTPELGKGNVCKIDVYPISRSGPKDVKSQRRPFKVGKEFPAEINAASSHIKPSTIADPPLPRQKVNCQKTEEKGILKKSPVKKIQNLSLHKGDTKNVKDLKKNLTTSTKQIMDDKRDNIKSARTGVDTKTTNEKHNFVLHSSYKVDNGTSIKEICKTEGSDSPIVGLPIQVNICLDNVIETPHSENVRAQHLTLTKNTSIDGDMMSDDLRYVMELENRIDWKSIFGMDLEKANATMAELQSPSLRREREPSGMRIFPDMEITVINSHYVCVDSCVGNLVGEMHSSMGVKEVQNDKFEASKTASPNCQSTGHSLEMQIVPAKLQDCKTSIECNSKPLSTCINIAEVTQSDNNECIHNQITFETKIAGKLACVKTLHTLNHPTMNKRLNNKRIPSVLIKKSVRRINKFSQSEENIKVVLGMLSDEIPLCKSKRISKKLDRAILHLRKAHKRVQKSLQLVAKVGERRNVPKTCSVQGNQNINNSNAVENIKQNKERTEDKARQAENSELESTSSKVIPTQNSSPNLIASEVQQQKSLSTDRKCLTESTEALNGVSTQDLQLTKCFSNSPSAKKLAVSSLFKSSISSPETSGDHPDVSSITISNKENAVPITSFPKPPSESKDIHVENCETVDNDGKLRDAVSKRRHPVCTKKMLSKVRKQGSSHAKTLPKCSMKKTVSSRECSQLKGKRFKDCASVTMKSAAVPSLLVKLSKILQKASETDSFKAVQVCKLLCKKMLPVFINSFEKKQQCVLKDVIVDRRLFFEQNLKTCFRCSLKPRAVEAFLELQMMIETNQFIENRIHYIEGRPTFRSLLWYDRSLYTELLMGESGYQQQSHFYTAFQKKLKHDALATLENHYAQLSEFLQAIHEQNSCYYVYLKYKRELKECEDVLKHGSDHSAFSLSVPFSCGVHLGDTIDDLAALQKGTLEIISSFINLPKCDSGKKEHALCLLEIISAKINFIKTSETISMQLSLFGIEHLLFDAAKIMFHRESKKYGVLKKITLTKESMAQKNNFALSKLYEVYCIPSEETTFIEKQGNLWNENINSNGSLRFCPPQDVFFVGKIIDQARCANTDLLEQMIHDCKEQLESQIKCFQILQECDVDEVLIRESNVLEVTQRRDPLTTLLRTEAVEAYIELVMTYETLHFLNCIIASQRCKERTRGLLWYDTSLLSDLLNNQERLVSLLQRNLMPNVIDIIDNTITEIKSELEIICDCTNSVNYSYAFQIMTRELSELSELKNFVLKSKSGVCTYIHFSPYVASLHYGSSSTELDYNYSRLSDFLDILMSTPKKDLGKMAHTMKIMKTIELTKAFVFKPDQSTFDLITCQVLQNRMKLDIVNKMQKESKTLNDQSSRKRTSTEHTASSSRKKQKVIKSSGKSSEKEREENGVESIIRAKTTIGMSTTEQSKDHSPVKKSCIEDSPQNDSKALVLSSQRYKQQENVKDIITSSDIDKSIIDSRSNPSSLEGFDNRNKSVSSLYKKSLEVSVSTGMHSKAQAQSDNTGVCSCTEPVISTKPDHENISETSDARIKMKVESSIEKEAFLTQSSKTDNVASVTECSRGTNALEEPMNLDEADPVTEEQEGKPGNCSTQIAQLQPKPPNWNNQLMPPMSSPYPQYPGSSNPWQYSLYLWYQNGSNTSVMSQGYQGVSYSTQQTNPYNQSSAFPGLQNSYATNQPYANFTNQIQTPMYPPSGPFGATLPYNYTDHPSASKQNPVPSSYNYSSTANVGWPWNSWQ